MKLLERVALVTGGAGGIGSAITRALAAEGAILAIHAHRRLDQARQLRDELRAAGRQAEVFAADLTREPEITALIQAVHQAFGSLEILVNNAGWTRVVPPADLAGLTEELIAQTFALKVNAPIHAIRAALPHLQASDRGCVINITSVASLAARGSSLAYAAANAALSNLTRGLARTLAPRVRVNAVAPGFVDTGFAWPMDGTAAARVALNNHLGRCVTPADIASAVRYLCADATAVTGEELVVDGGIARLGNRDRSSR